MQNAAGYTLIELVIMITIIGILAAMPFFLLPGNVLNVNAQARQFADDIRYTQALSMSKAERYRIVKASSSAYQILNSAGSPITFASGSTTMNLNSGLTFTAWNNLSNNLIAFDSRGTPYLSLTSTQLAAGTTYSIVISGGDSTNTITISPVTGAVGVQ